MALAPSTALPTYYPSQTLSVPLTTPWTAPPSCSTAIPRFSQGTCIGTVCTPDPNPDTGLITAWINWPYQTDLQSYTSTECQPSGYTDLLLFGFVSSSGCPKGYSTGTARTWPYDLAMSVVTCCPLYDTLILYTPAYTDVYGSATMRGDCEAVQTLAPGAPYVAVAIGYKTQTALAVISGSTKTTVTQYYTESVIATKTVSAVSGVQVVVSQPYVQILVPKSGPGSPTGGGGGAYPPSTTDSSSTPSFSAFGLPYVISIVVMVAIGLGVLILLCCCCCIVRRCGRSKPVPAPTPSSTVSNTTTCSHSRAHLCSYKRTYETLCCACKDSRPSSSTLTIHSRTSTFCYACQTHFRSLPLTQLPPAWISSSLPAFPEEDSDDDGSPAVDIALPAHLQPDCLHGPGRSQNCKSLLKEQGETACCVCKDNRVGTMPRGDRTALYCETCKSYWDGVEVEKLPIVWGIKCGHGDRYLKCKGACGGAGGGQCCACVDARKEALSKSQRVEGYCGDCKGFWLGLGDGDCPRGWWLKCRHGRANAWEVQGMQSTVLGRRPTGTTGHCCCACRDARTGFMTKLDRVKKYCRDCKAWWSSKPDSELPPEWQLSCRHGGMGAWCLTTGPNNSSQCCACLDTVRPKNMAKFSRLKTYCANCQNAWWGTPDQQCPPEWNLLAPRNDCKHSMALECMISPAGAETVWCCACRDGRKFVNLPDRLATYCVPCGTHWSQQAATGNVPVGWTVTIKDIPTVFQKPGCRPRKPKIEYPTEDQEKHRNMFDEGPRYGPPRFYDGRPAAVELPAAVTAPAPMRKRDKGDIGAVNATITPPAPLGPEPDYTGYEEKGPQRGAPRFSVAPDPSWTPAEPLSEKVAPPRVAPIPSPAPKTAAEKAAITAAKQRRKEEAGLCKGRAPVFQIPPG
ncbi:hypothetical protein QBC44DRAFT_302891 [Cladorrhinum sp. PSN332]|nr:hypothetical protein QBC44DRAFT_302891 [Cladorrhinum sp. PSN332]